MDQIIEAKIKGNFQKLAELFGGSLEKLPEAAKSESGPYMDAHFDRLYRDDEGRLVIGLAHYYKMNGDLVSDPSMEARIDYKAQTVEALSFQDARSYQEVYEGERPNVARQHSMNSFLSQWLTNMLMQRHSFKAVV